MKFVKILSIVISILLSVLVWIISVVLVVKFTTIAKNSRLFILINLFVSYLFFRFIKRIIHVKLTEYFDRKNK
jgi:hypothetical protein